MSHIGGLGNVLTGGGSGGAGGNGDVTGPSSSVDNTIVRFDATTGKLIQGSSITLSDVSGVTQTFATITPAATTGASQAGRAIAITASPAVASSDTAGAAAGGSITITSGAAARNASGNANGGNIDLVTGAGIGTGTSGQVWIPDGTSAAPSVAFKSLPNAGLHLQSGAVYLDIAGEGAFRFSGASGQNRMKSSVQLGWASADDVVANANDTAFARQSAGVVRLTDGGSGIKSFLGGGASVASATAMPIPTGRVFHVTGTTDITSITATNLQSGVVITLIFDGILTFTDGNNLKLAGNFVTSADDTITLAYDGTNFYEVSRSVN